MKAGVFGRLRRQPENTSGGCSPETLARSAVLHVQRCTHCETLSLHMGPLSVRFDPSSAEELWNTLGQALIKLHAQRAQEKVVAEIEPVRDVQN